MTVVRFYRRPALSPGAHEVTLEKIKALAGEFKVQSLVTEICFNVQLEKGRKGLIADEEDKVVWILGIPFAEKNLSAKSFLPKDITSEQLLIEIGPRLNFSTASSTNAVSICHSIGLTHVVRIEQSTRYLITYKHARSPGGASFSIPAHLEAGVVGLLHDKMTQCRYVRPVDNFELEVKTEAVYEVDILTQGRTALEKANTDLGLAFDDWDLQYYTELFRDKLKRNPTSVECFDLAQSNSEHCRHWFFRGRMVVDGEEHEKSLFKMVMGTQQNSNQNNVIQFCDNSSAIEGYKVTLLCPENTAKPSAFKELNGTTRHIIFTAETHNFPTGVAPFPGATTGTGGRIRDVQATGRGAHVIAGTAGYSFGNLHLPGYKLPWEDANFRYPSNFAHPREVVIEASNGASDYGNKFGEPVLAGFSRSFGLITPDGERREWVKPIMFSGGIGSMDSIHIHKQNPVEGMEVVKVGGPVYRIGVGGGAASSIQVQGDNAAELDFGAVQRGDAEMEQKMNRIIRACIEMCEKNPICSIHDQGAGGNGNVLKEICEPAGAVIKASRFQLGDPTLSILELWGAEYQESNAILVRAEDRGLLQTMSDREKCDVSFVGTITGNGKICLEDDRDDDEKTIEDDSGNKRRKVTRPVDLELEHVLGSMPRKVYNLERARSSLKALSLPGDLTVEEAVDRVLRLPAVASKRFLTNKVDRSVSGLVAQQQCVGPLHTPLADVAVTALSYFDTVGGATAIGEQPIKGLIDPGCGARMTVGEALTNLVFAKVSALKDVKCSGNWMWAAKLPGEGAALFDTCRAMCDVMGRLGIAVDGGKDSLSMAARIGSETVKAPGTLVISVYVACPDITLTVTPDLKCPAGKGDLLYLRFGGHQGNLHRLGGSALAQCWSQVGDKAPDMDDPEVFSTAFNLTQELIQERKLSAGHDVSDGGLITCLLEMAFAGNCGLQISIPSNMPALDVLFAEELGVVLEVHPDYISEVIDRYTAAGVLCEHIGCSEGLDQDAQIEVSVSDEVVLQNKMAALRDVWEATSFHLERLQTNPHCVEQEEKGLKHRRAPPYHLTFDPTDLENKTVVNGIANGDVKPSVAVIREEGSNGDREMVAAFHMAGFEVWDVNMQDLCSGQVTLDRFQGIAFVGGFSYADVCGSAKGWAATIKYHPSVQSQFEEFYRREDTFSLGVCNGCQLMALLGWVAPDTHAQNNGLDAREGVHMTQNLSERFESRFAAVKIESSPSVMLKGMDGCTLGIWVAHGEGRMVFKNDDVYDAVCENGLIAMRYVDDDGKPTTAYPLNPNGSRGGITALCSKDGRHLAMMPHPERCVLPWQWPWMPADWRKSMKVSPWLRMFQNAYDWCIQQH